MSWDWDRVDGLSTLRQEFLREVQDLSLDHRVDPGVSRDEIDGPEDGVGCGIVTSPEKTEAFCKDLLIRVDLLGRGILVSETTDQGDEVVGVLVEVRIGLDLLFDVDDEGVKGALEELGHGEFLLSFFGGEVPNELGGVVPLVDTVHHRLGDLLERVTLERL